MQQNEVGDERLQPAACCICRKGQPNKTFPCRMFGNTWTIEDVVNFITVDCKDSFNVGQIPPCGRTENKLAKLRRHASRVHFANINLG